MQLERDRRREREFDHTPAVLDAPEPGQSLYTGRLEAVVGLPVAPGWRMLPTELKRAWAQCQRFLEHKHRMAAKPGALRYELPETAPERHERQVQAVEARLTSALESLGSREIRVEVVVGSRWLRALAEAVVEAVETEI